MKFPALPFLKKTPEKDYFVALLFQPKGVTSVLLQNALGKLTIIATKKVAVDLEKTTTEELISASDEAISSTETSLPDGGKLEKTIFSVPYNWSDTEGNIKKDKLLQLKKISVELALKPMGFIITIEAVINFLEKKEGAPLTAVFVEESNHSVYLYLVRGSTVLEVQEGELRETVEGSVEHTLKKVEKFETLPPKMILLYNDDIENRQQKFLHHPWTKHLPFLHLPQISLLEKGFENEAVVEGIASQLNSKVAGAGVSGVEIVEGESSKVTSDVSFGFKRESDVADATSEESEGESEMEEDISVGEGGKEEVHDDDEATEEVKAESKAGILALLHPIPQKIKSLVLSMKKRRGGIKFLAIPVLAAVFFVGLMVAYYFLFLRAEVTVFTEGEVIDDNVLVTLSEEDSTSFEDEILHISTIEVTADGEASAETTGTEEIGESAKGEVTVFNKGDSELTLKEGSIITSSNSLKFKLDEEVKVASTSSFSTDISNKKVKVTANSFGKEYNLPSNTNFTIEGINTSSAFSKNEVAFSGGTKEEKQVVSEDDITGLEEKLVSALLEEAVSEAKSQIQGDEEVISVVLDSTLDDEKYSAKEGDEAAKITLTGAVTYKLGVYNKDEAKKFVESAGSDSIPDEFKFSDDDSEIELLDVEEKNGNVTGLLKYQALFKPEVERENMEELLVGKTIKSAEEKLLELTGVTDVTINLKNKLPFLPSILPIRPEQIEVKFETES